MVESTLSGTVSLTSSTMWVRSRNPAFSRRVTPVTPISQGGSGMNVSMQDTFNLGWKLAHVLQGRPMHLLRRLTRGSG